MLPPRGKKTSDMDKICQDQFIKERPKRILTHLKTLITWDLDPKFPSFP